ncbi:MAG: hypothetical protein AB1938_32145 [Myxococcota bacterium]
MLTVLATVLRPSAAMAGRWRGTVHAGASSGTPPFARLSVTGKGICRVRYRSGEAHVGSTFFRAFHAE